MKRAYHCLFLVLVVSEMNGMELPPNNNEENPVHSEMMIALEQKIKALEKELADLERPAPKEKKHTIFFKQIKKIKNPFKKSSCKNKKIPVTADSLKAEIAELRNAADLLRGCSIRIIPSHRRPEVLPYPAPAHNEPILAKDEIPAYAQPVEVNDSPVFAPQEVVKPDESPVNLELRALTKEVITLAQSARNITPYEFTTKKILLINQLTHLRSQAKDDPSSGESIKIVTNWLERLSIKAPQEKHAPQQPALADATTILKVQQAWKRASQACCIGGACSLIGALYVTYNEGFNKAKPFYVLSAGFFIGTGVSELKKHAI